MLFTASPPPIKAYIDNMGVIQKLSARIGPEAAVAVINGNPSMILRILERMSEQLTAQELSDFKIKLESKVKRQHALHGTCYGIVALLGIVSGVTYVLAVQNAYC